MDFDQSVTWQDLEARLAVTTDPRHRAMLQVLIDHGKAEAAGDVDAMMDTLGPDPLYHFWAGGRDIGPKGRADIRQYYEDFVASGAGFFESRKVRIVVDDDTIVTENVMRGIVPGPVAQARGSAIDDVDGHYLVTNRTVIIWPFDEEGVLVGEDSYSSSDGTDVRQVPDADLPDAYRAMLAGLAPRATRS